jgi:opacity protein-like surface antigen
MLKMVKCAALVSFAFLILTASPVFAAGSVGLSLSGSVVPFIDGDAGSGIGAPQYDDAFNTGWGARVEPYFDFNNQLRGVLGFTLQRWDGQTYSGLDFDDLNLWSVYAGIKYRFRPNSAVRPFVLADLGYAQLDAVNLSLGSTSRTYWDDTSTFLLDFGGGVEFVVSPNFSVFVDIRAQIFGEPDSVLRPSSDASSALSIPVSLGLIFTF